MRRIRRVLLILGTLCAIGFLHSLTQRGDRGDPRRAYRQYSAGPFFAQLEPGMFKVQYLGRNRRALPSPKHDFAIVAGVLFIYSEWDESGLSIGIASYWLLWVAVFLIPWAALRYRARRRERGFPL